MTFMSQKYTNNSVIKRTLCVKMETQQEVTLEAGVWLLLEQCLAAMGFVFDVPPCPHAPATPYHPVAPSEDTNGML